MAEITLHGRRGAGKVALVDDTDLALLSGHRFHLGRNGYARTYRRNAAGRSSTVDLHLLLTDAKGGGYRDHINGDKLDNRRVNLRPCTLEENNRNRPAHRNNKTGFKGVSRKKGGFCAVIHEGRKQRWLGTYPTAELAAAAYNGAARLLHGAFARLNVIPAPQEVAHAAD